LPNFERILQQWKIQPANFTGEQWDLYRLVIKSAHRAAIPFALGGGMAAMIYAGRLRDSKDIDIYVRPEDRERMIELVTSLGLEDFYSRKEYDRRWIYRSWRDGMIVDVMWAMANQRSQVDDVWLRGPSFELEGDCVFVVPPEEVLWSKIYVLQHDRCDWPDALNILYSLGPDLEWQHLLERLGDDLGLLSGLLSTFRWLCPERACELPRWLWSSLNLDPPDCNRSSGCMRRADLLDSRPWFTPTLDEEQRLNM
jgi:Uncharacterised nucleotidyltransferase